MFTTPRLLGYLLPLLFLSLPLLGCKAKECRTLVECCEASKDVEGIGSSCGDLAESVKDPGKCRTIVKTIHYVYEDREIEVPPVCRID